LPELAPIVTIAKLTMWEASRRKLLIAVLVLTVVVVGATGWGFFQLRYSKGPGGGAQIVVNVQAMDSRSFLDHSQDIAQAVREAMLNMHALNDVVSEI